MIRQIGSVIGVSMFVAVLGTPASPASEVAAFRLGWGLTAAAGIAAAVLALLLPAPKPVEGPAHLLVPGGPTGTPGDG